MLWQSKHIFMHIFASCRFLQLSKSLEKKSEESEADDIQKRKRKHSEGEDLNDCGEHNTMDLRSRKCLLDRTLPRRSMRLVSKVWTSLDHIWSHCVCPVVRSFM